MTKFKARPTVYKGIQMRSRLEAGFAAWLDEHGFDWEYEPCAFASDGGQYLPDFRLNGVYMAGVSRKVTVYVEVKPNTYKPDPEGVTLVNDDKLLRQAAIIEASEPGAYFILMQPKSWWCLEKAKLSDGRRFYYSLPLHLVLLESGALGFSVCCDSRWGPWQGKFWEAK